MDPNLQKLHIKKKKANIKNHHEIRSSHRGNCELVIGNTASKNRTLDFSWGEHKIAVTKMKTQGLIRQMQCQLRSLDVC